MNYEKFAKCVLAVFATLAMGFSGAVMKSLSRSAVLMLLVFAGLSACGGGGSTPSAEPPTPPPPNQAVGGAWVGTDDNGMQVFALSTDEGRLHWVVPATQEQGFGTASASSTDLTVNYRYVAPIGLKLSDGSSLAMCTAVGTIQERQSISVNTSCDTSNGGNFGNSVVLTYDALYDRDASLATLAGNYDDFGLVLNIDANGVIFEQDPASGCVVNGQVNVVDSAYNVYDGSITYSNCLGNLAILNGSTFSGLAVLDDTVIPESLIVGMVGDVGGGVTFSVIYTLVRL
jgi:hypothetical protein